MRIPTTLLIGGVIVILLITGGIWAYRTHDARNQESSTASSSVSFPVEGPTTDGTAPNSGTQATTTAPATMDITLATGNTGTVKDFIHNGVTIPDPQNAGMYYLAGSPGYCTSDGNCPSAAPSDDYAITYDSKDQFFTVILTAEPLGQSRRNAETFLTNLLGATPDGLCTLKYYLGTVNAVNETYSGKNLGFSTCAGATPLP